MSNKKTQSTDYITQNFHGTVHFKNWFAFIDGNSYMGVCGTVSIVRAVDLVGFEPQGTESNWVARVASDDGETVVTILGCQVRAVTSHSESMEIRNTDVLKL